jgi:predicted acyl esterase
MRILYIVICLALTAFRLFGSTPLKPSATAYIPMRDGRELPVDLYYPPGSIISDEWPCILMRIPAGRTAQPWLQLTDIARHGYVVAVQDTRSILDLDGKTMPYLSDGWDGYDTVEWLSKCSFTNGIVGTMGFSAAGITQLLLAPTAPVALACQYIGQAAASLYHHAIFPGGQLHKNQVESWLKFYAPHTSILKQITSQPFYNEFWKCVDTVALADKVDVPALHYTGWFDTFLQGTIDSFVARQENGKDGAKGNQKLVIGPWNHYWPRDFTLGEFQIQENGKAPPLDISAKRWFDYYLKGIDNDIEGVPAVIYYVMGPFDGSPSSGNTWKYANHWPVPYNPLSLFLKDEQTLNEKPEPKEKIYSFESDPENPVPTIGGRNLFLESGPKDQRLIEDRKDVLTFTTKPLTEDLEVTGKIVVKLYFSSNAPDTDVAVRLTDVYPDGKSILITDGLCRTIRNGKMLDIPQEITIDLSSTSIVFAKGHAIRLLIAGSNYPRFEKNSNMAWDAEAGQTFKAKDLIYVGENTPSRLILPVVPKARQHSKAPRNRG